ncbi:MAG TPA: PLP-dependent aminotransferase family protein [Bacillota bacterium]|jgi:DNA-binding transcriptional MocR family regulator|nr:PLP-dependent aminotransferase family protein [Bacillota bacterium]HOB86625.1 PLP-dependent aminotransferase family protein [Bacillota bacterium]HPT34606.1 PLP-dependent aminotransferase family protein [Bacillota bacterium]HPZ65071.1 PLP-dependent aminotransferase family protein [Bacillota bacterium]HQD06587.1 PLP-dependent aminotransferase family protein [Bacillota bacterium]
MTINWREQFAQRVGRITGSQIRSFFQLTERPEVISFAGGFPGSSFFPSQDLSRVLAEMMEEEGRAALQYGPTEGNYELRAYLAYKMRREGARCEAEDVIITNGSQQGLDLLSRILVNPGEPVLVEEPAYIGGMGALRSCGGVPVGVPMDAEGVDPQRMKNKLIALEREGKKPKLFYTVPNFQNPTGYTTSLERRRAILELASHYNFLIIEDNPYGALSYEGPVPPSYKSLDREGRVIYLGSFSKIFVPGIRIGWMAAPAPLLEKVVLLKQTADLCSNSLGQRLAYRLSQEGYLDEHVRRLVSLYREKRDLMLYCMERFFPEEIGFTRPKGGFFIWVTFPGCYPEAKELLNKALEQRVAFVHGEGFFYNGGGSHCARFSFSQAGKEDIYRGIQRLGDLFARLTGERVPAKAAQG